MPLFLFFSLRKVATCLEVTGNGRPELVTISNLLGRQLSAQKTLTATMSSLGAGNGIPHRSDFTLDK